MKKRISNLKHHPLNEQIYNVGNENLSDLVQSIKEMGVLEPILINRNNTIISGHRRWTAAKEAGLKTIDCVVRDIDEDEELLLLIHGNKQRKKTYSQMINEIKILYKYYRQSQGTRNDINGTSTTASGSNNGRNLDTQARVSLDTGISRSMVQRLMFIEKHRPDIVQYLGENITVNAAYGQVKLAVNQQKITSPYSSNGNGKPTPTNGDPEDDSFVIYNKSSKDMNEVDDESVDCIVTSPPYWKQRQYTGGDKDEIGNEYSLDEYLDNLLEVFSECKRIMKKSASLFIVIGDTYKNQSAQLIPDRLAIRLIDELGLYCRNDLIWWKKGAAPESTTNRWQISKEHIFFFTKHPNKYFFNDSAIRIPYVTEGIDRKPPRHHNGKVENLSPSLRHPIGKMPPDVIHTARFTNAVEVDDLGHSAPFPSRLIEPLIKASLPEGGICLDPFSGSGTTGEVALQNGGQYIGYDISENFTEMGRKRLQLH